jgi:hypothetical protein
MWWFAIWCFFIAALAWITRKRQDDWNAGWRDRFRLDDHYYEQVSTWVGIGAFIVGLFCLGQTLRLI